MATALIAPNSQMNEFKIYAGEAALGGSNPTVLTIPFAAANVIAVFLTPKVSVGSGSVDLTYTIVGGQLRVYAWVAAGTASAGTETFGFIVVGY